MKSKKSLYILFTLISPAFFLTACGKNVPDLEDRVPDAPVIEDIEVTYSGIIEPLELDIYQEGTHQLRSGSEIYIVQSAVLNLNRYLNKSVTAKGALSKPVGNAKPVLNITSVSSDTPILPGEPILYTNKSFGFEFHYTNLWELTEKDSSILLNGNGYDWIKIEILAHEGEPDSFIKNQETETGTPVTIGAQKSLRFIENGTIRIYIPNSSKNKIYKITFNPENREENGEKQYFFDLLETFTTFFTQPKGGEKCGGTKKTQCQEGFRCELASREEEAEGVCVSITDIGTDANCPYIAVPENCTNYEAVSFTKEGCPTRYQCKDEGSADATTTAGDTETAFSTERLTQIISENKDSILPFAGAEIVQYEISEEENLIAVVYRAEDVKYKTLYKYDPANPDAEFTEAAHFKAGEESDWELERGENLQSGLARKIISAERDISRVRVVSVNMGLYENARMEFAIQYPKNWYFRSFGAMQGAQWMIGFGDRPVDEFGDAIITMSIVKSPDDLDASANYRATKKRDEESMYVVEGPNQLKETIDLMASSIE
jgi:hypothetical protein